MKSDTWSYLTKVKLNTRRHNYHDSSFFSSWEAFFFGGRIFHSSIQQDKTFHKWTWWKYREWRVSCLEFMISRLNFLKSLFSTLNPLIFFRPRASVIQTLSWTNYYLINEQTWPFHTVFLRWSSQKMWNIENPLYVPWKHFILFGRKILISLCWVGRSRSCWLP